MNLPHAKDWGWVKDVLSDFLWSHCTRLYKRLLSVVALLLGCLPAAMLSNAWLTMKKLKNNI